MAKIIWTFELAKKESDKYNTKNEFKKNSRSAYDWIRKNKLFDDLCSHMIIKKNGHLNPQKKRH